MPQKSIPAKRTNVSVLDQKLWRWARMRSIQLNHKNISEYIFSLIEKDRKLSRLTNMKRGSQAP